MEWLFNWGTIGSPSNLTAQRLLETPDGVHHNRVDHLLVKLRISLGGSQSVLAQYWSGLEVHTFVVTLVGGVVIYHRNFSTHWTSLKRFEWNTNIEMILQTRSARRIEGVDTQESLSRICG